MDSSNTSHSERSLQHLSESVFMGLCKILGTPRQVAMRRDMVDVVNMMQNYLIRNNEENYFWSGSYGEGFRLKGSDTDIMIWPNNHRVMWDLSQTQYYDINRCVPILADCSESPPGFALLWLSGPIAYTNVLSACFRMYGRLYISSTKFREIMHSVVLPNSTKHGPCNLCVLEGLEYDNAHCFASDFLPPSLSSWIDRCHSWPKPHVVHDIVRNGCHFVAIGHSVGNHEDNEWRISFSQAEQKLVYAMNHCQFSTYGLLKLFLNEVINKEVSDERKLLCSYHMKTAVFWAIQQNKMPHWCPQNLLECFWICFKLILKWVYEGVCPNFFIPENNMFLTKIHGDSQAILFLQLFTLYEKGISCLLQSPSIRSYIIDVLYSPRRCICLYENTLIGSEAEFDEELFKEIICCGNRDHLLRPDLQCYTRKLHQIEQMTGLPLSKYQVMPLQNLTVATLQQTAFLYNMHTSLKLQNINTGNKNKLINISDKMSHNMLKLAVRFGCISDMLYLAMYYYQTCRYREALKVIERAKVKLAQPHLIYMFNVDKERYNEAVGRRSWSTKYRQHVANDIILVNAIVYISELVKEQEFAFQNEIPILFIPTLVLSLMLEFLCYRHVDTVSAQTALNDLLVLVHYDQGIHIPQPIRDISWQILGICQQITGDLQAALYSYQRSLKQYPFQNIQNATKSRIQRIMF